MNRKSYKTIGTLLLIAIAMLVVEIAEGFAQSFTWFARGSRPQDYEMGGDPTVSHGAENGGFIRSKVSAIDGFGTWMTRIDPGQYLGKGLRLTAYVKTANVKNWVGLWMRVDGPGNLVLSFDNMGNRPITGTTDWEEYEIVLDVPANSTGIFFGILLDGTGEAYVDGLQLEPEERGWIIQNSGISEFIHSIKAVDENTVWAGAQKGIYLRTTDGGANWTSGTVAGADTVNFFSIAAIDQNTGYFLGQNFVGGDGRTYKTSDGGKSWTAVSSFRPIYPATLVYVPHSNNSVLFVTSAQGSAYSEDGGATWQGLSTQRYFPMSFANPTAGWAPGTRAGRIVKFAGSLRTAIVERQHAQPEGFHLAQNYPNPF